MDAAHLDRAAALLRAGGIVAFPTETVYGLGANALDPDAVAKVFAAKQRPSFDPLIVHVAEPAAAWALVDLDPLHRGVRDLPAVLAEAFWPGPLTLVLPKRPTLDPAAATRWFPGLDRRDPLTQPAPPHPPEDLLKISGNRGVSEIKGGAAIPGVPGVVTAGLGSVGVRVPGHPVARQLIAAAGVPVAAPSANPFGGISPTRADHVAVPCDLILDGGPCATGVESTVVTPVGPTTDQEQPPHADHRGGLIVLRWGGISREQLEAAVAGHGWAVWGPGERKSPPADAERGGAGGAGGTGGPGGALVSPGTSQRHYAPRTPLRLVEPGGLAQAIASWQHGRPTTPSAGGGSPTATHPGSIAPETEWGGREESGQGQVGVGVLSLRGLGRGAGVDGRLVEEVLSEAGDLTAAAARLFEAMHRLDAVGLEAIFAEAVPEHGLGRAINDRLRRAAAR